VNRFLTGRHTRDPGMELDVAQKTICPYWFIH
jgi:hypothetical protein